MEKRSGFHQSEEQRASAEWNGDFAGAAHGRDGTGGVDPARGFKVRAFLQSPADE